MESFDNIKNELKLKMNIEVSIDIFLQVNFIIKDHFLFLKDLFGNLVIGLPSNHESLNMRKYKLKK